MSHLFIIAETFDFVGKVLLILMALMVHKRVQDEKKIDKYVIRKMKLERLLGIFSLILMIVSYIMYTQVV